ncbi:MAG: type VII toxin-antitoxin system HepT family RNase toxin [Planctomycetota bacterium]
MVADRLGWVERIIAEIRRLPLSDLRAFQADWRNVWAAESCLRRGLEALLDLGRHILSKAFGIGVAEYKEVARRCSEQGILTPADADLLRQFAGYRNRMVHFYHEIGPDELYEICRSGLADLERVAAAYKAWVESHAHLLDDSL